MRKAFGVRLVWVSAVAACSPCGDDADSRTQQPRAAEYASDEEPYVHPARRCGECHTEIEDQWKDSAHARASRSPLYRAMREHSGRDDCVRCHEPLAQLLEEHHPSSGEGVTCDACHTQRDVEMGPWGAELSLRLYDNVRYGPICEAQDHYFHRVECSPVFAQARFCAGCHLWQPELADGKRVPVYTEYSEWQQGPYVELEVPCQDCHMPARRGEIASGWDKWYEISHHGMLGLDGELRRSAIEIELEVEEGDDKAVVRATLRNSGAGHRVPTGLPARRLQFTVRSLGASGEELDSHRQTYARVLVDGDGEVAPHYEAKRVASDNRLPPRESTRVEAELEAREEGKLTVHLTWHAVDDAIARRVGLESMPEPVVLLEGEVVLGAREGDGARTLRLPR